MKRLIGSFNTFGVRSPAGDEGELGSNPPPTNDDATPPTPPAPPADDEGKTPSDSDALKADLAKVTKESMKRKQRLKELEQESVDAKASLEAIKASLGELTPEEIAEIVASKKEAETKDLEKKGEYDRILERMREENKTKVGEKDTEITSLRAQLQKATADIEELTVGRQFGESEFLQKKSAIPMSMARKEFGSHFEMVDGEMTAFDKPRGAENRTPLVDENGVAKPFNLAIKELFERHADAKSIIKVSMKPGTGTLPDTDKAGASTSGDEPLRGQSRILGALAGKK
jgi:hypothetical protein